jgi:hypothetical protein
VVSNVTGGISMETQTHGTREEVRNALYERLKVLNEDDFMAQIRREKDTKLLGDIRYKFGLDPNDPGRSAWQTREINRLLTDIKARREALPQWIGIVVSNLIALAALVVSIVALFKT